MAKKTSSTEEKTSEPLPYKQTSQSKKNFPSYEAATAYRATLQLEKDDKVRIRRRGTERTRMDERFDVLHLRQVSKQQVSKIEQEENK